MSVKIDKVALAALCLLLGGVGDASSEDPVTQENQIYSVSLEDNLGFKVRDLRRSVSWRFAVSDLKDGWRLSPAGKFISYRVYSGDANHWCLLDLSTRSSVCSAIFDREENELPWSPNGRWLAWKSADQTVAHFALAELISLKGNLLPEATFSIQGHPLGLIWQQKWISESEILLGTGVGESMCFGVADLDRRRFYSLSCLDSSQEDWFRGAEVWLENSRILQNRVQWQVADERIFPWVSTSPGM